MDRQFRKNMEPMLTPHYNIADSIPITDINDDGIIESRKGLYSKTYLLTDINFQTAQRLERSNISRRYRDFLNTLDPSQTLQITIHNHNISGISDVESVLLPEAGDDFDHLRSSLNEIILKNSKAGSNGMKKEKYFTLSQEAVDFTAAEKSFITAESELLSYISDYIPGSNLKPLNMYDRLNLIHEMYNSGEEGNFSDSAFIAGKEVDAFSLENMYKQGVSVKELVQPSSMEFYQNYFKFGDAFGRALDLDYLPKALRDTFLNEITNVDYNCILTFTIKPIEKGDAFNLVDRKLTNSEAEFVDAYSKTGVPSHRLRMEEEELEDLMNDIYKRDQSLFDCKLHVLLFAPNKALLDENTDKFLTMGKTKGVGFNVVTDMQEQSIISTIPLGYDCTGNFRTLNSEAAAAFIPFSAQELQARKTKNSIPIYYGINKITKSVISYDRFSGDSYNGMILGSTGSGKSMMAKLNLLNTYLADPDADIIVLDPNNEYRDLCSELGGQVVDVIGSGTQRINPLEIDADYGSSGQNPVAAKVEFLQTMIQVMHGANVPLTSAQQSAIVATGKKVYDPWVRNGNREEDVPTLQDFYEALCSHENAGSAQLQDLICSIQMFTEEGVDVLFSGKTNVNLHERFVDYAIGELGDSLKPLAMLIILDNIWTRMCRNKAIKKKTYIYIDEAHLLFSSEMVAQYLQKLYKTCRKYNGAPICITQDVEDILSSQTGRTIINNSPFVILLKQSQMNQNALADLLKLSSNQLSFINNSKPGEGLLCVQASMNLDTYSVIPFKNSIPEDNEIFSLITTKIVKDDE